MLARRIAVGAIAVGAAAATLLGATPSLAASPTSAVDITAGSFGTSPATALNVVGTSKAAPFLKDNRSGGNIQCPTATVRGMASTGANQSPSNIAQITSSTWGPSCTAAGGSATITQPTSGTGSVWTVNATMASTGGAAPFPSNNESTIGSITGIKVTIVVGSCTFMVSGSVTGTYSNGDTTTSPVTPPMITISTSSLTASNIVLSGGATSCAAGIIQNGDTFTFTGAFNIAATNKATGAAANPLRIHAH